MNHLVRTSPHVTLVIVDAGHFLQRDAPERVSELLIDFVRNSAQS